MIKRNGGALPPRFALSLIAVILLFGCGGRPDASPASPDAPHRLNLAVEFSSHSACAHLARRQGWFREAGIEIGNFENHVTGMALSAALARGSIDAAYICLLPAVNARANAGVPFKIVSGVHRYGYALVVDPVKIRSFRDLARPGIRLGCNREGSPPAMLLQILAEREGLDRSALESNLKWMNSPRQMLALRAGRLDAAFMNEQYPTMAEAEGYRVMVSARDLWPEMPGSVLVVREELIEKHPEVVARLVGVTERAIAFLEAHPDEAAAIVAAALNLAGQSLFPAEAGPDLAAAPVTPATVRRSLGEAMLNETAIDLPEIQKTIDRAAALGYIRSSFPAAEMVDTRFLR